MAKWKKEEVRVWRLPADVAFGDEPCVVASYPGDRWETWTGWGVVRAKGILADEGAPWLSIPEEPRGKNAEACRNGEMDKYLDPEFGPKAPRELANSSSVDSKIAYGSKKAEPFRRALTEVWRVALYGQGKHGANNWQHAEADGMHFYEDALWRHLQARRMGEVKAEDSGCYHLAHLAWNALMLLEMELRGVTNPEWFGTPRRGEG
jgi:hypothetical protein